MGFATIFMIRFFRISDTPPGAVTSEAASADNVSVTGNAVLEITATAAASNVLTIYKMITVLITPP